jgi:hypothetical protein
MNRIYRIEYISSTTSAACILSILFILSKNIWEDGYTFG